VLQNKYLRPSGKSNKIDEGFGGAHFLSPLSGPISQLHTIEATIDSGTNLLEFKTQIPGQNIVHGPGR